MTMASMADYLKKYTMSGDDGAEGGKKKKRRKKPPGSSRSGSGAVRGGGGLRIIDDREDTVMPDRKQVEKAWEDEEAEEEKPTLVEDELEEGKRVQSGSWSTVGGVGTNGTEHDASSPRRRKRHDSSDEEASPPRRNRPSQHGPRDSKDASPPRRRLTNKDDHDASPPRRKKRHDSSDEDASPPRRNRRSQHGPRDGEDASPPRRRPTNKDHHDASPPRRRKRHDSSDEDGSPPRRNHWSQHGPRDDKDASPPRRRLTNKDDHDASPPRRRKRHDSSDEDASPPRRSRQSEHGNGDSRDTFNTNRDKDRKEKSHGRYERNRTVDASPPRRTNRAGNERGSERRRDKRGSNPEEGMDKREAPSSRKREQQHRHDSTEEDGINSNVEAVPHDAQDASPPRKRERGRRDDHSAGDESDAKQGDGKGDGSHGERSKTSSGYYAGLQSGKDFKIVEQQLRQKQQAEMKAMNKANSGQGAETVYRDKKGRKLDMLTEFKKKQEAKADKKAAEAEEQFAWGQGKVQKEEQKQWKEEVENIAAEPFARSIEDSRLEEMRKAEIRADDPMAAYIAKKKSKEKAKSGKPSKPEYKGPAPKPNRFGIRPGYRWDGVDRGNGWEDKIVDKSINDKYKADLAHKWATADM